MNISRLSQWHSKDTTGIDLSHRNPCGGKLDPLLLRQRLAKTRNPRTQQDGHGRHGGGKFELLVGQLQLTPACHGNWNLDPYQFPMAKLGFGEAAPHEAIQLSGAKPWYVLLLIQYCCTMHTVGCTCELRQWQSGDFVPKEFVQLIQKKLELWVMDQLTRPRLLQKPIRASDGDHHQDHDGSACQPGMASWYGVGGTHPPHPIEQHPKNWPTSVVIPKEKRGLN